MIELIVLLLFLAVILWTVWQFYVLVGEMAELRGQNRILWQIASLIINPIGAMLLLWMFFTVKQSSNR